MEEKKIIKGKSGLVFYEYTSWCHRYKTVESNGKIRYLKMKGFKTEEEALESYYFYKKKFEDEQREFYATVNKDIMFKDYLIHWFEHIYSERIETTTKMVSSYIVYDLIIPNIEYDVKINLVTTDYLDEITDKCAKTTKSGGYSAKSIIFMAMKDAVVGGYITYNPALNMKVYYRDKPNIRVLSKPQMNKFLTLAQDSNWYLEILLGLFCGLRKGEILGLKFSDFDLIENSITIKRQLVADYKMKEKSFKVDKVSYKERHPKTKTSIRRLRLPDYILAELIKRKEQIEKQKMICENYIDNGYVSCREDGQAHCFNGLNCCIEKICYKLGLPKITVHGLRHMCATILIEEGANLARISAYLGHTSIHTTFEYYCDVMDEKEKILSYINNIFSMGGEVIDVNQGTN